MKIRVGHLYPDYLNIYADRGNIAVLDARAGERGHQLELHRIALMQFTPQFEQRPGKPMSESIRMMEPHMAARA